MISMTYGQLPDECAIEAAVKRECPNGLLCVNLNSTDTCVVNRLLPGPPWPPFTEQQLSPSETVSLLGALTDGWESGDDEAGSLASSILEVLGFEWI